jgi:hypothetical protein
MNAISTMTLTVAGHEHFWDFGVLHDRITFDDGTVGRIKASIYRHHGKYRFDTETMTVNLDPRFVSMPVAWVPKVGDVITLDQYQYGWKGRVD